MITAKGTERIEEEIYLGWLLAGKLAEWLGMEVGMVRDQFLPNTTTLCIVLPSGTAVVNIPLAYAEGKWKTVKNLPHVTQEESHKAVQDCLNGFLTSKFVLVIPEQKEDSE